MVTENDDMLIINDSKPVGATIDSLETTVLLYVQPAGAAVGIPLSRAQNVLIRSSHFWKPESIGAR